MAEPKSAAGGDWLDEEVEIPELTTEEPETEQEQPEPQAQQEEQKPEEPETPEPQPEEPKAEEPEAEKPAVEEEPEEPKKQQRIPKKRFDQVNERLKEAQRQLREIREAQIRQKRAEEEGGQAHGQEWFDEQEELYMEAVIDGDKDKAKQIRTTIRTAEAKQFQQYTDRKAAAVAKEVPEQTAVQQAIGMLEERFPQLDQNADTYDRGVVAEVLALQRGYMQDKDALLTPAQALLKAAARLGMDLDAEIEEEIAPAPAPAAAPPPSLSDATTAVETANAQPPEMGSRSGYDNGEDAIDWNTFTEEDLEKLPASKLKELRGDTGLG